MDNVTYKNEFNRKKYDAITMQVPKGYKATWQEEAERRNMSLTAFVCEAVNKLITEKE